LDSKLNTSLLWIPFGAGPRLCIGKNFSLLEQRLFLATLLRKYKWELVNKDDEIQIDSSAFIIHTAKKMAVKFIPRTN
jgi:cytochrome P450